MANDFVLELPTDVRSIEHAVDYVMRCCERGDCTSPRVSLNLRVGLTEALSNAMLYGNGHDPSKRVRVELAMDEGYLQARVIDQGEGFDPDSIPDPTTPENIEKTSGRGLFLMRQMLDEVTYNDQGNQVTLVLRLGQGSALEGGAKA